MENKHVGYLILGISVVIVAIVFIFNNALRQIINSSCTMAGHTSCEMFNTLNEQTYLAVAIVAILAIFGLVFVFSKPKEKLVVRTLREKKVIKEIDTKDMKAEEKQVLKLIQEHGTIFQADLIEKIGFGKAKVTRILDKLEGRDIIERKRRGMTNVVVLK